MCLRQIDPPTDKASCYVDMMRVFVVLQFVVAGIDIACCGYFVKHGVFGIFLGVLMLLASLFLNYQILLVNMVVSIYFMLDFLLAFLWIFQSGTSIGDVTFFFIVTIASFCFYLANLIFSHYPYK